MAAFFDLEDSPMFQKQVCSLEQTTDELKNRCQGLHKGCKKFVAALTEACNGDSIFADALESFGGGQEDPLSLSMGGPLISKFIGAFRELATYKELLRSQVEHVLVDRLNQFMSVDLEEAKDSRRRFDKSIQSYDQAREKYASLKKSTREDIVAGQEEDLHNSKSAFERTRFNLVNALINVESKKKYEFLESFSAIMDAHLRYFKLGYDLLSQMEPLIHQVLTYAQQSKEAANAEQDKLGKRIQEFRTQVEMDNIHASSNTEASTNADCPRTIGIGPSYKDIQALMQSSANGTVQTIKQGYLLKHSSSLRANWKRRFFVLDSHGALYYYITKSPKSTGSNSNQSTNTGGEQSNGVFRRFRARHSRTSSLNGETSLSCRPVDLRTSTIKIDAEDPDLRLCFRIISPSKSYTLQAENEADRMEWVNKITGVITSLLNAHLSQQEPFIHSNENYNNRLASEPTSNVKTPEKRGNSWGNMEMQTEGIVGLLREIPGNDQCAECSAPEPDWASLNLGILMCIECSGAHRNLGVHISKIRSITLDVKVWEPTILELFKALGNAYCNSVWEELLSPDKDRNDESGSPTTSIVKPSPHDSFNKEKYIQMKYAEKQLISQKPNSFASHAGALWEAVKSSNLREAYRLMAISDSTILNTTYEEIQSIDSLRSEETLSKEGHNLDPSACPRLKPEEPENCLRGCSLLHVACHIGNVVMIELLLQSGVDPNMRDFHGRTPLHHCIAKKNNDLAKYILRRGARRLIKDWGGLTALERAMELGSITDEQLFILLSENE